VINITVTLDDWNIGYLSPSTGDPQTNNLDVKVDPS